MSIIDEFKLINEKRNVGVWLSVQDLINLAKICKDRNTKYYNRLIEDIEFLTGEKLNIDKYILDKPLRK